MEHPPLSLPECEWICENSISSFLKFWKGRNGSGGAPQRIVPMLAETLQTGIMKKVHHTYLGSGTAADTLLGYLGYYCDTEPEVILTAGMEGECLRNTKAVTSEPSKTLVHSGGFVTDDLNTKILTV